MTITVIDAFAARPFSGNPAAVCVLGAPVSEAWMQGLAAEMNLAETAFLTPAPDGTFGLRWFTPEVEVDLCGHATLASAHLLYESGRLGPEAEARFDTASGRLTVRRDAEATYTMDFPATPPAHDAVDGLAEVLGVAPLWTGRTRFDLFAVLADEAAVRSLRPDLTALQRIDARGLIATAAANADTDADVVSRFFAPGAGVPEDPVTGSAHCAIGPYWADRFGRVDLACIQASRRGGHVSVGVRGDRVELTGRAVTVYRAELAPAACP